LSDIYLTTKARDSDICSYVQPSDGPIQFKKFPGMDEWDYNMQNRDAKIFREGIADPSLSKAAWWDWKAPKKIKA